MTAISTPFLTLFGRTGLPLTAGSLYIGTQGQNAQSNPIQVYFDDGFTVPAAQPIRTVGGYPVNGGTPAQLFVNASGYSMVLRDQQGSLVYSSMDVDLGSDLTGASIGLLLFPRTAAEIAAGVTPTDYTKQPGDILRYGAAAGGVSGTNTTAINNALASNSLVFCNVAGTYTVNASLNAHSDQTVRWAQGVTIKADTSMSSTSVFLISEASNFQMYGGIFDGDKANNADGVLFGVRVLNGHNIQLYGVTSQNMPSDNTTLGAGGDAFYVGGFAGGSPGSTNIELHGCSGLDCVRQGLSIVRVESMKVIGGRYNGTTGDNPGGGIDVEANPGLGECKNISIVGADFSDNAVGVILTTGSDGISVVGCTFSGNREEALQLNTGTNYTIVGNTIESGVSVAGHPVIDVISVDGLVISGNTIKGNAATEERSGIRILFGRNMSITGNFIRDTAQQGIQLGSSSQSADIPNVLIQGNSLLNCVVSGTAAPIAISGNTGSGFYPTQVTCINNQIIDTRSAGAEADVAISFASFPAAVLNGLRVGNNHIFGPALDFSSAFDPPLMGRVTWNPADLVNATGETSPNITVSGAALGDAVIAFPPLDLLGLTYSAYVSATDTVVIRLHNGTGANVNLGSASWKVRVIKPNKL